VEQELYELDNKTLVEHILDSFHLLAIHYGLWFCETEHQFGLDKTIEADDIAWKRALPIIMGRITKRFGIPADENSIPKALTGASKDELIEFIADMAKNWVASDGVWFQAVENNYDYEMYNAKRINDSCWNKFSYIEANRIIKKLGLPERGGIPALKKALKYRQFILINKQEIIDVSENKIIFRMNECRVQTARKRSGLPEYPCKSGGVVEYMRFAEGINPRIKTTCIDCPPDPHPDEWYCAWEFELPEGG
jgi:hypothetical protein